MLRFVFDVLIPSAIMLAVLVACLVGSFAVYALLTWWG